LPLMPEWYLVIFALAVLSMLGLTWPPLLATLPLLVIAAAAPVVQAAFAAARAQFPLPAKSTATKLQRLLLTFVLHQIQPVARLIGRIKHGLTPWRRRGGRTSAPVTWQMAFWSENWMAPEAWIAKLECAICDEGGIVVRGECWDLWDLYVRGGPFGGATAVLAVEEHGAGRQLIRCRAQPRARIPVLAAKIVLASLAALAAAGAAWVASAVLLAAAGALAFAVVRDCAAALDFCSSGARRAMPPPAAGA